MSLNRRKALRLGLAESAALAASAAALTVAAGAVLASERAGKARRRPNHIPNVEVIDQDGRAHRFYDDLVKDKVVTLNVFYAECGGSCPLVTENLKRVYDMFGGRVGRDIHMYTITLKPEQDGPELLKQYVDVHGIGPGWRFLTGKPADIELLRTSLGFSDPEPERDIVADNHTGMLRYGNDRLRRWAGGPALARPEGIYFSITRSVMDAGIGAPAVPAKQSLEPSHQHHHNK